MEEKEEIYPIPSNLNECFSALDEMFKESEEDKAWFLSQSEDEAVGAFHHGLGRWIRNNWGLWTKNSELYNLFNDMGLWHADDMSGVILTSYHRKINNKEINLKEQIQHYIDYWKEYEQTNGPVDKD